MTKVEHRYCKSCGKTHVFLPEPEDRPVDQEIQRAAALTPLCDCGLPYPHLRNGKPVPASGEKGQRPT